MFNIFRNPSSKLTPGNFRFNDFPCGLNVAEIGRKSSGRFSLYPLPVCSFAFGIKAKIQIPSEQDKALEELVELQLRGKSQKFRRGFYRWYFKNRLDRKLGRPSTDAEIDEAIISERTSKYGAANAKHACEVIKDAAEHYERLGQFPMKFKECLRRVIGGRSYGYNLPIFKAFWRNLLKTTAIQNGYSAYEQTDEYIEERTIGFVNLLKSKGVDRGWFNTFEAQIPTWRKAHRINPQRKNAANSRWLKEKRKKLLAVLIHRINELSHDKGTLKVKVRIKKISISHSKKSGK